MADDMNYNECKKSEDHYWVNSDEVKSHCRRKPN